MDLSGLIGKALTWKEYHAGEDGPRVESGVVVGGYLEFMGRSEEIGSAPYLIVIKGDGAFKHLRADDFSLRIGAQR